MDNQYLHHVDTDFGIQIIQLNHLDNIESPVGQTHSYGEQIYIESPKK